MTEPSRAHEGYCYPDCGCADSAEFDWDAFAADINGGHDESW